MMVSNRRCVLRTCFAFIALGLALSTKVALAIDPAVVAAAKKEGALSYATNTFAPTTQKELQAAFRKHYGLPDSFKIDAFVGKSSDVVARVSQEVEAKRVTVDFVSVNVVTFWHELQDHGEILKYCSDEYKHLTYRAQTKVLDGGCEFQALTVGAFGLMWNPAYIKDDITTWAQLTNPKYKDKIIFGDVRKSAAYLDTYVGLRENKFWTRDWLEKIKAQNPFFLVRSTDIRDRVMSGEFPVAILAVPRRAYQVREQVTLKVSFPTDGVVLYGSYAGILKRAPHPNAAKLWTDFLFSKEGQEILSRIEAIISLRSDLNIPAAVKPYLPDLTKIKAAKMDWMGLTEKVRTKYRNEFRGIFSK